MGSLAAVAKHGGSYTVKLTHQLIIAIAFLLFSIVTAMVGVTLGSFTAHRMLGAVLLTTYIACFIVITSIEFS